MMRGRVADRFLLFFGGLGLLPRRKLLLLLVVFFEDGLHTTSVKHTKDSAGVTGARNRVIW